MEKKTIKKFFQHNLPIPLDGLDSIQEDCIILQQDIASFHLRNEVGQWLTIQSMKDAVGREPYQPDLQTFTYGS